MRIIFFGSPASALFSLKKILESGHDVPLVVTQPDRPSGRGRTLSFSRVKLFAQENNILVYQPEKIRKDANAVQKIKEIGPDLIVVHGFGQIIPRSIIYLPRHNSLNVHFSLLPRYRGASPVQWAILNGDSKTGVTIFELNEKMDEGDLLIQEEITILPGEKAFELETRMAKIGAELLVETIARIEEITPQKQDHSKATYAPKIKKENGRIDWKKNASALDRQVRAFSPWPSAFFFMDQTRIKIIEGSVRTGRASSHAPGEILEIAKQGIVMGCGEESCYVIQTLQPENKKAMTAYSFAQGARIKPRIRFS
jgi:methionyl-tRNA formyltransferase